MPQRRQLILGLGATALLGAGAWALKRQGSQDRTGPGALQKLRVRFPIPALRATMAPFVAAKRLGWYGENGLDVEFGYGGSGTNPVAMTLSGHDDVGILGGPDTLVVADGKGANLVAIAVLHKDADFPCLITLAKSGITRVEQLEGKRVGMFPGHISADVLRSLFRKANVSVQEVDVGYDYSQLLAGQLAAQWAFTTAAAVELPEQGIAVTVISPATHGIRTHGYTIFVRRTQLTARQHQLQAFLAATFRGLRHTHDAPAAVAKLLVAEDTSGNLQQAQVERRLAELDPVTPAFNPFPPGYMDRAMFESTYARLLEQGLIEKPYDVAGAFDTRFLRAIHGSAMPAEAAAGGATGGR